MRVDLRGYRLFVDDLEAVWRVIAAAGAMDVPGVGLGPLKAMISELEDPASGSKGLVQIRRGGRPAQVVGDLSEVTRDDVDEIHMIGTGMRLILQPQAKTGWIELQVAGATTAGRVLDALPAKHGRLPLQWHPYTVRFIPRSKSAHRERQVRTWTILGVAAAVLAAAAAWIALLH